jgi:hypothetical protein
MDQHRLAAACHLGVATRHMYPDILMRAEHYFGRPEAIRFKPSQFFDESEALAMDSASVLKKLRDVCAKGFDMRTHGCFGFIRVALVDRGKNGVMLIMHALVLRWCVE